MKNCFLFFGYNIPNNWKDRRINYFGDILAFPMLNSIKSNFWIVQMGEEVIIYYLYY